MRKLPLALIGAASIALGTPALAGPVEDFHQLMDDYWATQLKESPLLATSVGVKTYDAQIDELSLEELRTVDPRIGEDALPRLSVEASVTARRSAGGTAPERVREAIAAARAEIAAREGK